MQHFYYTFIPLLYFIKGCIFLLAYPVAQWYRICLPMQEMKETQVPSLGQEDPLDEGMATHSSILAWRIQQKRILVGYSS